MNYFSSGDLKIYFEKDADTGGIYELYNNKFINKYSKIDTYNLLYILPLIRIINFKIKDKIKDRDKNERKDRK